MTIKAATKFAIVGVSFGFAMSIISSYLFEWAYQSSGMKIEAVRFMQHVYFHVEAVFYYGGMLVFFITLHAKQKAKDK